MQLTSIRVRSLGIGRDIASLMHCLGERHTQPVSTPSASDAEHTSCGVLWVWGSRVALVSLTSRLPPPLPPKGFRAPEPIVLRRSADRGPCLHTALKPPRKPQPPLLPQSPKMPPDRMMLLPLWPRPVEGLRSFWGFVALVPCLPGLGAA